MSLRLIGTPRHARAIAAAYARVPVPLRVDVAIAELPEPEWPHPQLAGYVAADDGKEVELHLRAARFAPAVALHEIGHAVYRRRVSEPAKDGWSAWSRASWRLLPTPYARQGFARGNGSVEEAWCECFSSRFQSGGQLHRRARAAFEASLAEVWRP